MPWSTGWDGFPRIVTLWKSASAAYSRKIPGARQLVRDEREIRRDRKEFSGAIRAQGSDFVGPIEENTHDEPP